MERIQLKVKDGIPIEMEIPKDLVVELVGYVKGFKDSASIYGGDKYFLGYAINERYISLPGRVEDYVKLYELIIEELYSLTRIRL